MNKNNPRVTINTALLSAVLAGSCAYSSTLLAAADSRGESDKSPKQSSLQNQAGESKTQGPGLEQVDQNNDRGLSWSEVNAIYNNEIEEAGWNQEYVFDTFDEDDDAVLSEDEYVNFVGNLVRETVAQADPPSSSELDTTAGMNASENELEENVNSRARQMRVNEYSAAGGEDSNAMEKATEDRPNERQTADYKSDADSSKEDAPVASLAVDEIEDREVVNADGENLGQVESVVTAPDGSISGVVVGVGGFWQVGNKDVFVPVDQVKRSGENIIWDTELDEEELKSTPHYTKKSSGSFIAGD